MAFVTKLLIDEKEIEVISYSFGFKKQVNEQSRPTALASFNGLEIEIESTQNTDFEEWMKSEKPKSKIQLQIFYPYLEGGSKIMTFYDCYLIGFQTIFSNNNYEPMKDRLRITSGGVKAPYSSIEYTTSWRKTFENENSNQYKPAIIEYCKNDTKKAKIINGIWINEKSEEISYSKKVFFGEEVKIKLEADDKTLNEEVQVTVKAKIGSKEQKLFNNGKPTTFKVKMKNGEGISKPFLIDLDWYNEIDEKYDYENHKTIIKHNKILTFIFETKFNGKTTEFPKKENNKLVPITYRRNYEESLGLFKYEDPTKITTHSKAKDPVDNFENHFIRGNSNIENLVDEFSKFLQTENLTIEAIKERVKNDAKELWMLAIKQAQAGNLDDRPLYWARNKMQVSLKRHSLFKEDINFETSIIYKDTELKSTIKLFEELSRNYTDINFLGVTGKKILITGFDPFLLNSFNHPDKEWYNILQSNPSGCVALALTNNNKLDANVQTMIFPVRYTDFDGKTNPKKGQGEGVVEKYIKPLISEVDMIITISQKLKGDYDIDVFATSRRGGGDENMNYTRIKNSQALSTSKEWLTTTLPNDFLNANFIEKDWSFVASGTKYRADKKTINQIPKSMNMEEGSGGNYLSNEIFYRVAKMRDELKPNLPTGHFHINKYQNVNYKKDTNGQYVITNGKRVIETRDDFNNSKIHSDLKIIIEGIKQGIKKL